MGNVQRPVRGMARRTQNSFPVFFSGGHSLKGKTHESKAPASTVSGMWCLPTSFCYLVRLPLSSAAQHCCAQQPCVKLHSPEKMTPAKKVITVLLSTACSVGPLQEWL